MTVGTYLNLWLQGRQTLRPSTRTAYSIHLTRYLIPHLGDIALSQLTVFDIEQMYRTIETTARVADRPLSATTVRRIHATLMSALGSAVRRDLLVRNPAVHVELARPAIPSTAVWTASQLHRFLDKTAGHPLHPLLLLYAVTGMRRGEGLGLRWCDVDLDARTLRVSQQVVLIGEQLLLGPPKTSSGRRVIAIPGSLADELRAHRARQLRDAGRDLAGQLPLPRVGQDSASLVFAGTDGQPLHPAHVSREFARLTAATNLPSIRLHDLRHTSASLGLASGETLLEVSRRLGHSSIGITADVYSHLTPATARASADRLAQLITDAAAAE